MATDARLRALKRAAEIGGEAELAAFEAARNRVEPPYGCSLFGCLNPDPLSRVAGRMWTVVWDWGEGAKALCVMRCLRCKKAVRTMEATSRDVAWAPTDREMYWYPEKLIEERGEG